MMELKNKKTKQNKQLPEACNNGRVRGVNFAAWTCSNEGKSRLRGHTWVILLGKVQSKKIPHEVKHSDLQATMILLANINIYFMLKRHKGVI